MDEKVVMENGEELEEGYIIRNSFSDKKFIELWTDNTLSEKKIMDILGITEYRMRLAKEDLNLPDRKIGRKNKKS